MARLFSFVRSPAGRLGGLLFLLALAAVLAAAPAAAQAPRPGPPLADSLAARPAAFDTAATVHRLFVARRRGNRGRVLLAGTTVLTFNYLLAFSTQDTRLQQFGTGFTAAYLSFGLYQLGAALLVRHRYSPRREAQVLAALAQGQPLPPRLRHQLLAAYGSPPIPAH